MGDESVCAAIAVVANNTDLDVFRDFALPGCLFPSFAVMNVSDDENIVLSRNPTNGRPPDSRLGASIGIASVSGNKDFHRIERMRSFDIRIS